MFFLKKHKEQGGVLESHGQKPPVPLKRTHLTTGDSEQEPGAGDQSAAHVEATDSIHSLAKSKFYIDDVVAQEAHDPKGGFDITL
ncbi:hypothetical protein KIN20_010490 [Parelaphostrongylus tenuis]|uniref:Uncharacterized protein n=1 Tax=Parelaphostrongylus tenuis TaxID=148309 RepID=A0AAD5MQP7_PARTN|nr:hypothetical protein KIN20_010490 [Parelaphostrongylus tenuis]